MDRIEEIKTKIEQNSRTISKFSTRIQELKDEIDKIDSRIKWIPSSELDEEGRRKANRRLEHYPNIHIMPGETPFSYVNESIKDEQIMELKKKRDVLLKELESCTKEKDRLKEENITLRSKLETLKK